MKNLKIYTCTAVLLCMGLVASAQQDAQYTQYMFNTLSVNPAYAGSADLLTVNLLYRNQWTNLEGAPKTQTLVGHMPLSKESISVGGSIVNDRHGPVNSLSLYGDASYRIPMGEAKLAFGLKVGIKLYQADLVALNPVQDGDPAFETNITNRTLPNFGTGVMYYSQRYQIGLSIPGILSNKLIDSTLPDFSNNKEKRHVFLTGGYVFDINNYVRFRPTAIIKYVDGSPLSVDLTASFLIYDQLWIGAMHRWQDSFGLLMQYIVREKIRIGYSYDYTVSPLTDFNNGSHEIMIGMDFGTTITGEKSPRWF